MTRRLYYEDSFIKEFDALVISCENAGSGYKIILDKTGFFPEGGGQRADTGFIDNIRVFDVQESDSEVCHFTDKPVTVGKNCKCCIDWEQRFRRMQNHSGEHIVSGIVHKKYGYDNVGFHMGAEDITIDFNGYLNHDQLIEIEQLANIAVSENVPITTIFPKPDELGKYNYRSKLELTENVRLVKISGYDLCACCAPHVNTSAQIGMIRIFDSIRHKSGVRVHLLCGLDALDDYIEKSRNVEAISTMLSAKQNETAKAVERLKKEKESALSEIYCLKKELENTQIRSLKKTDGNICVFTESFDAGQLRNVVNAGMELCSGICAAFSGNDNDGWKYIMGSRSIDMGSSAKDINTALNGRGGGRGAMIQGSVAAVETEIRAYFNS